MPSSNGRPQIKRLPLESLMIDKRYQRPVHEGRVAQIVGDFEPIMCGVLEVSTRPGGKCAVLDGQHRLQALHLLGETEWDCRIHDKLTARQEAALFVRLQTERYPVHPIHRHKALVFEGNDLAVRVEKLVTEAGYRITTNKTYGSLACVGGLYQWHERYGAGPLRDALAFIDDVWTVNDHFGRKAPMVGGITLLLFRNNKLAAAHKMDLESLKERLGNITSAAVLRDAQSQGSSHTTHTVKVAMQLQEIYNRRRTTGRVNISFGRDS